MNISQVGEIFIFQDRKHICLTILPSCRMEDIPVIRLKRVRNVGVLFRFTTWRTFDSFLVVIKINGEFLGGLTEYMMKIG